MTSSPKIMDLEATYPVAEKRPDLVKTGTGHTLDDISVDGLTSGRLGQADITITAEGLLLQADIARSAKRPCLAENFERGAELVAVPDEVMLATYELLRPGRAKDVQELRDAAQSLRDDYGAERVAQFIEEAATVYEKRGLFRRRF